MNIRTKQVCIKFRSMKMRTRKVFIKLHLMTMRTEKSNPHPHPPYSPTSTTSVHYKIPNPCLTLPATKGRHASKCVSLTSNWVAANSREAEVAAARHGYVFVADGAVLSTVAVVPPVG